MDQAAIALGAQLGLDAQLDTTLGMQGSLLGHQLLDQGREVHLLAVELGAPGLAHEQVIGDALAHARDLSLDPRQVLVAARGQDRAEFIGQDLRVPRDRGEGIAQVVRDGVAEGFELAVDAFELGGARAHPPFELGDEGHVFDGHGRRVGQDLQQPNLGAGRAMRRGPVRPDGADRALLPDGDHDQALHEGGGVGVHGDAGILVDVRDGDGFAMDHGPAADAALHRKAQPLPEGADRIFVRVKAAAPLAQDEGRPVGPHQRPGGSLDDGLDLLDAAGPRELLHDRDEPGGDRAARKGVDWGLAPTCRVEILHGVTLRRSLRPSE
ncbi:hypothetical protein D3C86_1338040 [compost metagenome]